MSDEEPQTNHKFALSCPICAKAAQVEAGSHAPKVTKLVVGKMKAVEDRFCPVCIALVVIMGPHPRCQACSILLGPGHLESGLANEYCGTHARPGPLYHGGGGRVQVRSTDGE